MLAAIMRNGSLVVDDAPDPRPGPGQVLCRTIACGICGSDLHALVHGDLMVAMADESGIAPDDPLRPHVMDLSRDVILGHEFAAEVIELGPDASNCAVGDIVVSMPITFDATGIYPIGYANEYPGGYAEQLVLSDLLALKVPNGLDARRAALTEPMAVGEHAAAKSGIRTGEAAIVLGCGPVGLAVIAALAGRGIEPIVAADFSPTRRALASIMGAHAVVDPKAEPAIEAWRRIDSQHATRTVVVFEAVGVPGLLDQAMTMAPRGARVVVVGVCMQPDTIRPMIGIGRELTIQFVLGYDPMEFASTLNAIAEGTIDVAPLITGSIGIAGVPQAFRDLADPDAHAKILVEPGSA